MKKETPSERIARLLGEKKEESHKTERLVVKPVPGKNGGARPGSGRKPGSKNAETVEKEKVLTAYRQKILKSADKLFQAQMTLATGTTLLYCITTRTVGHGKNARVERSKPELVTDSDTIEAYLAGDFDGQQDNEFYFITTKEPNNSAIDSLTNRVFGKPVQPVGGDEDQPLTIKIDF